MLNLFLMKNFYRKQTKRSRMYNATIASIDLRLILIFASLIFCASLFGQSKCTEVLAINYNQIGECVYEDVNVSVVGVSNFSHSNKLTKLYLAIKSAKAGNYERVDYTYTVLKYNTKYFLGYNGKGEKLYKETSAFNNLRFGQVLNETVKAFKMYEKLFEALFPNLDINFIFRPIEMLPNNYSYLTAADIIIEPYRAPFSATYAITSVGSLSNISFNTAKPYGLDCSDTDNFVSFLRIVIHELGHSFGLLHCFYESKYTGIRDEIMLTKIPSKNDDICDYGFYENKFNKNKYLRIGNDLLNSYVIKHGIFKIYNQ